MGELVIISGPFRGLRVALTQDVLRLGRDRSCEIHLDDEAASRVHSEIVRRGSKFILRDMKSTNGTYLNDARVAEATLQNGDRIGIGDTVLLLQLKHKTERITPQIIFSQEPKSAGASLSLNLGDTRFLEMKEGTTIPDAQRQFTSLYEFMVDIAGILHLPALLERAMTHFFKTFPADRGLILLLTPDGEPGTKLTRTRDGIGADQNITISRTMAQQLLQKKESFLSVNAPEDLRLAEAESLHRMHVFSIMGAPLKVKDKVGGMIYLDTIGGGTPFSEMDLKLCTAMALQLAVCLENTRLYTELLNALEFNNSVLKAMGSGIVVVDMTGKVLRVNRATVEVLQKSEAQLMGRSLSDFPELAELSRVIQTTIATGRPEDRYEVLVRAANQVVPLGLSTSLLTDHSGEVIGVVANFRNLSPLRKLEEQVRRSHHLAALGQMAAGVAHEIRNPLNSIRGFAQLLQETNKEPATKEYPQIILEEVDRMNRIVQDLLDFSRQRDLTLLPVQLTKLLEDLVRDMQIDAKEHQITLEVLPPEFQPPNVLGNADKLRQVFRNVVLNAVQACNPAGRVTIAFTTLDTPYGAEAKVAAGDAGPGGREVAVMVEDTGCGIDQAVLPKIFDPFFTQKETGTGLGLSISQKIIEQHGGRIEVKSELNRGSIFSIHLPAM